MSGIRKGDTVILLDSEGNRTRVQAEEATRKIKGLGVVNLGKLLGKGPGSTVRLAGRDYTVIMPSVIDVMETLERKAQIIVPKDAAYIVLHCGVGPGSTVVEAGSGSGSLTMALAGAVAPDGKVISYDNRPEHQEVAKRNVARAGLSESVVWKVGDILGGIEERGVDAVVLDIPNPWDAVLVASEALRPGGHIGTYSPTANQVERTVNALREAGFVRVSAVELILREMVVSEGGIRPSFDMMGHSGYICTARWPGR